MPRVVLMTQSGFSSTLTTTRYPSHVPAYLYIQVDLCTPAQVREVSARFQMSSSGIWIQFVHFLLSFQRERALIKHLHKRKRTEIIQQFT